MSLLLPLLAIVVLAIIGIVAVAFTKPDRFTVQRTIEIAAPPERIFAEMDDFHKWVDWSPWEKMDPTMQKAFSGPAKGVGSHYAWVGNKKVGIGSMTIREVKPAESLSLDLAFEKPFKAQNDVVFTLIPEGGVTKVSWAMHGKSPFMFRVMGLFMDMDAMIGKDFEHGLHKLKDITQGH